MTKQCGHPTAGRLFVLGLVSLINSLTSGKNNNKKTSTASKRCRDVVFDERARSVPQGSCGIHSEALLTLSLGRARHERVGPPILRLGLSALDTSFKPAGRGLPVQVHLGEHEQASGQGAATVR